MGEIKISRKAVFLYISGSPDPFIHSSAGGVMRGVSVREARPQGTSDRGEGGGDKRAISLMYGTALHPSRCVRKKT